MCRYQVAHKLSRSHVQSQKHVARSSIFRILRWQKRNAKHISKHPASRFRQSVSNAGALDDQNTATAKCLDQDELGAIYLTSLLALHTSVSPSQDACVSNVDKLAWTSVSSLTNQLCPHCVLPDHRKPQEMIDNRLHVYAGRARDKDPHAGLRNIGGHRERYDGRHEHQSQSER